MNFVDSVKSGYQNYVNFSGRSARSAFWWWVLFQIIVWAVILSVEGGGQASAGMMMYNAGPFAMIWSLVNLLPGIAIAVRRMHDIDRSGWWLLIVLIPLVGWIILIVWYATNGTSGGNRFGPDPLSS